MDFFFSRNILFPLCINDWQIIKTKTKDFSAKVPLWRHLFCHCQIHLIEKYFTKFGKIVSSSWYKICDENVYSPKVSEHFQESLLSNQLQPTENPCHNEYSEGLVKLLTQKIYFRRHVSKRKFHCGKGESLSNNRDFLCSTGCAHYVNCGVNKMQSCDKSLAARCCSPLSLQI